MSTDAQHDSVTFLTYGQLIDAFAASVATYNIRLCDFENAADAAYQAAATGDADRLAEAKATMAGHQSSCRAQAAMTEAIADEISARVKRGDYA